MKQHIWRISLVLTMTLVLLESSLRLSAYLPFNDGPVYFNTNWGYLMRPNIPLGAEETVNSLGFNDIEHDVAALKSNKLIAVVGDSFTQGVVDRSANYVTRLRDAVKDDHTAYEVVNIGLGGAGPKNYLGVVEHVVADLEPDIIVLAFFVGNDIVQAHRAFITRVWQGVPRETLQNPLAIGLEPDFYFSWKLVNFIMRKMKNEHRSPEDSMERGVFLSIEKQRMRVMKQHPSSFVDASYRGTKRFFSELKEIAAKLDSNLLVVLIPDEVQVNRQLRSEIAEYFALDLGEYDFQLPQKILTNYLQESGISCLDLLPIFLQEKKSTYLRSDTHWNPLGNRLAADRIFHHLVEHDLLH